MQKPMHISPGVTTENHTAEADWQENSPAVIRAARLPKNSLNATAYRIFKLLQWLIQGPVSVDDLNTRFYQDPFIQKKLSDDSILLYVNTLRMLGCQIERPKAKNGFQYRLVHHPFGLSLTEEELEILVQAKSYAQTCFSPQAMMHLDELFRRVILSATPDDKEEALRQFFERSRSYDYESSIRLIADLEKWTEQPEQPLLSIMYASPVRGEQTFLFLPQKLNYERGALYLEGDRPDKPDVSILRVDRILKAEETCDESVRQVLLARRQKLPRIVIRFFIQSLQEFDPLGMGEEMIFTDTVARPYVELELYSRDFFSLKQKLLERGQPFQVIEPVAFRDEMRQTLQAMMQLYEGA